MVLAGLAASLALGFRPDSAVATEERPARVVIAVLPHGVTVDRIGAVEGLAPGVMSAGLGRVLPTQSFLDISQGNRTNENLYGSEVPPVYVREGRVRAAAWQRIRERAADAPAAIVPGLLASVLKDAGVPVRSATDHGLAPLIAADRSGAIDLGRAPGCELGCAQGLTVIRIQAADLGSLVRSLAPQDHLVVFAAGFRSEQRLWPIAIRSPGFTGNLTSDSTRTDGLVLTTDLAASVLDWLGVAQPNEFNGSVIRAEGEADPLRVIDLQERLADRPGRDLVALLPLGIWLLAVALAALLFGRPAGSRGLLLFGLACVWAPLLLLIAAALDASEPVSALITALGAPLAAVATALALPGLRGLAVACGATVGAHAIDVVAGSPFTAFSVLGPNPGGGVRFFGIGNELEAILTTLTLIGCGAGLAALDRPLTRRAAAFSFAAVAGIAILAFAPGRFGADVGAAIVLGVGGATATVLALGVERRRAIALVVAGGVGALGALVVVDLVLGGAHLSRSVLGASDTGDLAEVFERRIALMIKTFTNPVYPELLALAALVLVAGFVRRDRVLAWFGDAWLARCGFLGAVVGVLVGTLANDSGSVLLVIGTIYLAASAGYFWGLRPQA